MKYSVLIPVHNEEENVARVHREAVAVMEQLGAPYEIIFIDDGSTDKTLAQLRALTPLTVISLRKNFGQTAALDAGIKHAHGDYIITLDGDGQNPPSEIIKLVQAIEHGPYDAISGWRKQRHDPLVKRLVSRGAHLLRSVFVKDHIHDSGCSLKIYKRACFDGVDLYGEMHRFIPAILLWSGFTVGEVSVEHRPRQHGSTKYGWQRIVKAFIDMLSIWFWRKYATRPLHLFGGLGMLLILISGAVWIFLAVKRLVFHLGIADSNLPLLGVLLVILGFQFFISGLLADIAIRQYYARDRHPYAIREIISTTKGS